MKNRWVMPGIAVLVVIAAVLIVLLIPSGKDIQNTPSAEMQTKGGTVQAKLDADGNVVILSADLSDTEVSFIRMPGDSKIELLACLSADGGVKVALGTCQACNGSPEAYYVQEEDRLVCRNCGQKFRLSVLESPGTGCRPMMIDPAIIQETAGGIRLDGQGLAQYEPLFEKVTAH